MAGDSFVTISGTRYKILDAVIENLLKQNFVTEIKMSNIGIAMTRF